MLVASSNDQARHAPLKAGSGEEAHHVCELLERQPTHLGAVLPTCLVAAANTASGVARCVCTARCAGNLQEVVDDAARRMHILLPQPSHLHPARVTTSRQQDVCSTCVCVSPHLSHRLVFLLARIGRPALVQVEVGQVHAAGAGALVFLLVQSPAVVRSCNPLLWLSYTPLSMHGS